jgi:hypothetical protein
MSYPITWWFKPKMDWISSITIICLMKCYVWYWCLTYFFINFFFVLNYFFKNSFRLYWLLKWIINFKKYIILIYLQIILFYKITSTNYHISKTVHNPRGILHWIRKKQLNNYDNTANPTNQHSFPIWKRVKQQEKFHSILVSFPWSEHDKHTSRPNLPH